MGVDEAGAGEVVGSFYVGYVETDEPERLEGLGLRDSKDLNLTGLEKSFEELSRVAETGVMAMSPAELDETMAAGITLQEMEDHAIASLVSSSRPDVLQVDCYYPRPRMLERRLRRLFEGDAAHVDIRARHGAEGTWPLVAAAGIVAKVHQVREFSRLRRLHGDVFGSGNGSDSRTRSFMESVGEDAYFVRSHDAFGN